MPQAYPSQRAAMLVPVVYRAHPPPHCCLARCYNLLARADCGGGAGGSLLLDERLLKLTMPGRVYTGPLTSATVDLAKHALVVGDATLREISKYVVLTDGDSRPPGFGVDTRAFMLCLLPWLIEGINNAAAADTADALLHVRT
jgi:hypothetical protein